MSTDSRRIAGGEGENGTEGSGGVVEGDGSSEMVLIDPCELLRLLRALLPVTRFSPEAVLRMARPKARIRFVPLCFDFGGGEAGASSSSSRLAALPAWRSKSFEGRPGELLRLARSTRRIVRLRCVSVLVSFSITNWIKPR